MLDAASSLIKLNKLQQHSVKVKEKWCDEQEEDFKRMVCMIDDLMSHAVGIGNSSHSYNQLEYAKANFLQEFMEMAGKYRLVQE